MEIDIRHVAKLARLKIEESEIKKFEGEMQRILQMVENLPSLPDDKIAVDPANPMQLRPDEVKPSQRRDETLKNAPQTQTGCFVVPKTVE